MGSASQENNQPTNVLHVTVAAQGHVNPMLRLGNHLASKGLYVTLATHDYALKHSSSTVGDVHLEFFSDGLPQDYDRQTTDFDFYTSSFRKFGPINLSTLIQSNTRKFACIINTPFVPWAADVAEYFGLPCAMVWIQPCIIYQIYYCYYNRLNDFPTENNPNMNVKLPGLPSLCPEELPSFVLPSNTLLQFDSILNEVFQNMHKIKWVLGNSFMELEKDVITSMNNDGRKFLPVGPIVPATLFGKKDNIGGDLSGLDKYKSVKEINCSEWLDKQNPASVVYISFGSLIFPSEKHIESIVNGLKNTKRPFLWILKLAKDQEYKQYKILEEIKEQGLIVNWSPQTAFITSVSWVFLESLWVELVDRKCDGLTAGVPVIACPQWSDQPTNAKLVTDSLGVGVKLRLDSNGFFGGDEVARCVEEIMSGPRSEEFRKNTAELKTATREAVADGSSSDKNIQLFVKEVVALICVILNSIVFLFSHM